MAGLLVNPGTLLRAVGSILGIEKVIYYQAVSETTLTVANGNDDDAFDSVATYTVGGSGGRWLAHSAGQASGSTGVGPKNSAVPYLLCDTSSTSFETLDDYPMVFNASNQTETKTLYICIFGQGWNLAGNYVALEALSEGGSDWTEEDRFYGQEQAVDPAYGTYVTLADGSSVRIANTGGFWKVEWTAVAGTQYRLRQVITQMTDVQPYQFDIAIARYNEKTFASNPTIFSDGESRNDDLFYGKSSYPGTGISDTIYDDDNPLLVALNYTDGKDYMLTSQFTPVPSVDDYVHFQADSYPDPLLYRVSSTVLNSGFVELTPPEQRLRDFIGNNASLEPSHTMPVIAWGTTRRQKSNGVTGFTTTQPASLSYHEITITYNEDGEAIDASRLILKQVGGAGGAQGTFYAFTIGDNDDHIVIEVNGETYRFGVTV